MVALYARWVDLADATDAKLQELVDACDVDPALDGTFLKAWKMDASNFATRLDVADAGIIEHVATEFVISRSNQGRCRWVHALQLCIFKSPSIWV